MSRLEGQLAAGHVRYSTTGDTILRNVQPLFANLGEDGFAVGHNGEYYRMIWGVDLLAVKWTESGEIIISGRGGESDLIV